MRLSERLEVAAQVPVVLMQSGEDLTARGVGQPREGLSLGTPYLSLRLGILSERGEDPVDLSVGVQAGFPLGSANALARESSLRAIPSIMVGKKFGFLRAGLDAGASLRPRTIFSDDANVRDELGDELHLGAGAVHHGRGAARRAGCDCRHSLPARGRRRRGAGGRAAAAGRVARGLRAGGRGLWQGAGHAHLPRAAGRGVRDAASQVRGGWQAHARAVPGSG